MNVAVFGDTHGHLRLVLQLCRLWQMREGVPVDAVLQCGDLGFFPDLGTLDKATRRFAARDPEELGFARFFGAPEPPERDELVEEVLLGPPDHPGTLRGPVIWCHGNHEDFTALEARVGSAHLTPVDAYNRFFFLRSGRRAHIEVFEHGEAPPGFKRAVTLRDDTGRRVAAFPVGAEHICDLPEGPGPTLDLDNDDANGLRLAAMGGGPEQPGVEDGEGFSGLLPWVERRSCERLSGRAFDVLISHCAPRGMSRDKRHLGSQRLRELIEGSQPEYCFFSHHGVPIPPADIGSTRCFWLNDVNFCRQEKGMLPYGRLAEGCMGILRWAGPGQHDFTILRDDWLKEVTWSSWRQLCS